MSLRRRIIGAAAACLSVAFVLSAGITSAGAAPPAVSGHFTFTTFDVPGTASDPVPYTDVLGINNPGVMVGQYFDVPGYSTGNFAQYGHGFIADGSHITTVDVPGAIQTLIQSINDQGTAVGFWIDTTGLPHGFIRSPSGAITTLIYPGSALGITLATGINDQGVVVGYYDDSTFSEHGFMYRNGQFTTIDTPGFPSPGAGTELWGINNSGVVDGLAYSGEPGNGYDTGLTLATRIPRAQNNFFLGAGDTGASNDNAGTFPQAINDPGAVVGHSLGVQNYGVFVGWEMLHGQMITITDPLADTSIPPGTAFPGSFTFGGTAPGGINNAGTVTGIYFNNVNFTLPDGTVVNVTIGHGFVATPMP
jgi:probable HAF family extracellular repeat protein